MEVEAKDVIFGEITEMEIAGRPILRLRGLVFHSAMAVEAVSVERDGDFAHVHVTLVPTGPGRSGNFALDIPLEGVTRVLFGPSAAQVWPKP